MIQQSALDIYYLIKELNLEGAKIDQCYQYDTLEFAIRFHLSGEGRKELVFHLPHALFFTQNRPEGLQKQMAMASYLRKELKGMFVQKVFQPGFTRVIGFEVAFKEKVSYLFAELFDKGNLLFCHKDDNNNYIIDMVAQRQVWQDRALKPGAIYNPQAKVFPYEVSETDFIESINESLISKQLATTYGLGGKLASLVCNWANVDPKQENISFEQKKKLYESLQSLFRQKIKPTLIESEQGVSQIFCFEYPTTKKHSFAKSISEAYDSVFQQVQSVKNEDKKLKAYRKQLQKLEVMYESQIKSKKKLEETEKSSQQIGSFLYEQYTQLEPLLDLVKKLDKEQNYKDKIKYTQIVSVDKKTKKVVIDL